MDSTATFIYTQLRKVDSVSLLCGTVGRETYSGVEQNFRAEVPCGNKALSRDKALKHAQWYIVV